MGSVGAYCRVSDDKKKSDGDRRQDIDRQVQKAKVYCKTMELDEPIFFIDDGISAYKDDFNSRPEYCRLQREVRANRIKIILLEDITRWSRNLEEGIRTLKEVGQKAKIISLAEGELGLEIPEQWFKTTIGLLMAEWASKITAYKVKSGMARRLENPKAICKYCGKVHLGRLPNVCAEKGRSENNKSPLNKKLNSGGLQKVSL